MAMSVSLVCDGGFSNIMVREEVEDIQQQGSGTTATTANMKGSGGGNGGCHGQNHPSSSFVIDRACLLIGDIWICSRGSGKRQFSLHQADECQGWCWRRRQ